MLSLVIFLILTFNLLRNYCKWVIVILSLCPFFMQFLLWQQNLLTYLFLIIILLFPIKYRNITRNLKQFPLKWACFCIAFSLFAANYFAPPANKHTPATICAIVENTLILYIFYYLYKENPEKVFKTFIRTNFIFGGITCIYCLFEGILQTNPYIDFMGNIGIYNSFDHTEVRHGIKRVQAFYSIYTSIAGLALYLIPLFISYIKSKKSIWKINYIVYIFLLFIMLFFSGMRTGIVCISICLLTFINKHIFTIKNITICILLCIFISFSFHDYLNSFIDSMIHTDQVSGSTEDGRERQWTIALLSFVESPIWGHGYGYTFTDLVKIYPQIQGADSIWITLMIEQGIVGIISYIIFFISLFTFAYKRYPRLCFFIAGILCSQTIASITSFNITHMFFYVLIMIHMNNTRLKELKPITPFKSKNLQLT